MEIRRMEAALIPANGRTGGHEWK